MGIDMPRSTTTSPDRAPGKGLGRRALVAVGAGLCAAAIVALQQVDAPPSVTPAPQAAQSAPAAAPAQAAGQAAAQPAARRVYPYSVVPGGVADKEELARVIKKDKVVAAHYTDFAVDQAREVKVSKPRAVYVSYRKGDQVYWTAKKVMLAEGESLLTDGSNELRARCANRISDVPRLPVEANGPTEEELDSSVMQVSSSLEGDEGTPYIHQLQTFATGSGGAPGEPASASGMDIDLNNPSATGNTGWTTLGSVDSSSSTSSRPKPNTPSSGTGGGETPGGTEQPASNPPQQPGTTPPEGTPPTGGSDQPDGGNPPGKPPVETSDPPPETRPDVTPLIPEPNAPPPVPGDREEEQSVPRDLPEPGSLWLSFGALGALFLLRRKPGVAKR